MTSPSEGKPQYRLFRELEFCSNKLVGVRVPIMVDQVPVLELAYGQIPLVWLRVPADPKGEKWAEVVTESKPRHPNVAVESDTTSATIRVKVGGHDVLRVVTVSETTANVTLIDFRVFGIPIVGNESGLQIGGSSLVGNFFAGTAVGFHLSLKGGPPKPPDTRSDIGGKGMKAPPG